MLAVLKNKKVLGLSAFFIITAVVLFGFGRRRTTAPEILSSPAAPYLSVSPAFSVDAAMGQDLLAALALLKTIRLDTSMFTDPLFKSLSDWGKEIPSQPVGRRNPFAPLGATLAKKTIAVPAKPPAEKSKIEPPTQSESSPDSDVWDFSDIEFQF